MVVLTAVLAVLVVPGSIYAQSPQGAPALEIESLDIAPSADKGIEAKFDPGFYQKIQNLIDGQPQSDAVGSYNDTRHYGVLIVVSRDNGDGVDPDETAKSNKEEVARQLKLLGARDIVQGGSLSFVTASVPVEAIPQVSLMGEVYRLGDGEEELEFTLDASKSTTHSTAASIKTVSGVAGLNGSGVTVALIERTMYNPDVFDGQIAEHVKCNHDLGCRIASFPIHVHDDLGKHGVQVAQIIGASGLSEGNGIAPGVDFINIFVNIVDVRGLAHSLDWFLQHGVDLVNMSYTTRSSTTSCNPGISPTHSLLANEAVDKGMVVVAAAGNNGNVLVRATYESVYAPGCAHNVITVGGISDRQSDITMYRESSRGPTVDGRLKPEIVAPAHNLRLLEGTRGTGMSNGISGTSFAAPQVVGAAALMLQADPDLTPAEIKAALLLGAAWQGPDRCTSSKYEDIDPTSGCSHAKQILDHARASDSPAALQTLNNVGLGILNTTDAVRYVLDPTHVRSGYLDSSNDEQRYRFTVTDPGEQTKIILTWMVHPHGGIDDRVLVYPPGALSPRTFMVPNANPTHVANLDFITLDPDGLPLTAASGMSARQNVEFAVFAPTRAGTYTIIVSGTGIENTNKLGQKFALASTSSLEPVSASNTPPTAKDQIVTVGPGMARKILLTWNDADGDAVSFRVSKEPEAGHLSNVEFVGGNSSYILYTPTRLEDDSFEVVPYDDYAEGQPATITLVPESLPSGARSDDIAVRLITETDMLEARPGSGQSDYSLTFPGKGYPVSMLQLSSSHMIEPVADARIGSATYTMAVPLDGSRRITFASPVMIDSVTLSAKDIDAGFAQRKKTNPSTAGIMHVSVGYKNVPTLKEPIPDIFLLGPNPHYVKGVPGGTYDSVDPGASCKDGPNPDYTVKARGLISIAEARTFTVTYECADDPFNVNSTARTVIVDDKAPLKPTGVDKKTVMLNPGDPFVPSTAAACRQDSGTRVSLDVYFHSALIGSRVDVIDTNGKNKYTVVYACRDQAGNQNTVEHELWIGYDLGAPQFLHPTEKVQTNCSNFAKGVRPSASFNSNGLTTSMPYTAEPTQFPRYIEIESSSTDKTLAVYNFETTPIRNNMGIATTTVSPNDLALITDNVYGDSFWTRMIYSKVQTQSSRTPFVGYIDHPGVGIKEFETFHYKSSNTILTPDGTEKAVSFVSGMLAETNLRSVGDPTTCWQRLHTLSFFSTVNILPKFNLDTSTIHLKPGAKEPVSCENIYLVGRNDTFRSVSDEMYTIHYTCTDGTRDANPIDVTYVIDGTAPTIALHDDISIPHAAGGSYTVPTLACTDANLPESHLATPNVTSVHTDGPITHTVRYSCSDPAKNDAVPFDLQIIVTAPPTPQPTFVPQFNATDGDIIHVQPGAADPVSCTKDGVIIPHTTVPAFDSSSETKNDIVYTCTDGTTPITATITMVIDGTKPIITLTGGDTTVELGGTYVLPVATCTNPPHGQIDDRISKGGDTVDADTADVYTETYDCQDPAGNDAEQKTHTVTVQDTIAPVPTNPRLHIPAESVVHRQGMAFSITAGIATCTDNSATTITYSPEITPSTSADTHEITITCEDSSGRTDEGTLLVIVADLVTPVIRLNGPAVIMAEQRGFADPGAVCIDVDDGNSPAAANPDSVPDSDTYPHTFTITYSCTDSDGNNAGDMTRTVTIGKVGDNTPPVITINGYSKIRHLQDTAYEDEGATCKDSNYGDLPVDTHGTVDTNVAARQTITYTCTDGRNTATAVREIHVQPREVIEAEPDTVQPEIEVPEEIRMIQGAQAIQGDTGRIPGSSATGGTMGIIGSNGTIEPEIPGITELPQSASQSGQPADGMLPHPQGVPFEEPALPCMDNINGLITANSSGADEVDVDTPANYDLNYDCQDASGNDADTVTIQIMVQPDTTPPRVDLNGNNPTIVRQGEPYTEEGARCIDNLGRYDQVRLAVVTGDIVQDDNPGTYKLTYTCEDAVGLEGDTGRTVIVSQISRGSNEDWQLNPTFGRSWESNSQIVQGGFGFNGRVIDVTNNFHTPFAKDTAGIGDINTVTAKAYTEMDLQRIILYMGVPDLSRATDSEAHIIIEVRRDYSLEEQYEIISITHEQEEPLLDTEATTVSISRENCRQNSEIKCAGFDVEFRVMAPLSSDIMAISAMDTDRRVTVSYINDGVDFVGESLLPAATHTLQVKKGNQHPVETIHLTQQDRRYNIWADQHGFVWIQNEYDSWEQLTHAKYERLADPSVNVMTRTHSSFADLIEQERARATLIFNATELRSEVGESFAHDAPVRIDKLQDPIVLEKLKIAELAALEYLERK